MTPPAEFQRKFQPGFTSLKLKRFTRKRVVPTRPRFEITPKLR